MPMTHSHLYLHLQQTDHGRCIKISLAVCNSGVTLSQVVVQMVVFECGTVCFFLLLLLHADQMIVRTGQAHRTLVGHTMPVTCLQFDEQHLISGSLDKSIRIWDLRTGGIEETIRYDGPITALQFDSRKIVTAAGENGANVSCFLSLVNSADVESGIQSHHTTK